ncbi:hypothetical protein ACQR1W_12410 [Bradyrhizobium sp. HKCCYLS1011]|uniref:hypothetical protein n=1 Tax=Bradyrhizobium sp. HKCCYLS1011 TaxID=3420733 RepID=UPI003EBEAD4A
MLKRSQTKAVLEAEKLFKPRAAASTEYEEKQRAFYDNRERLKAERLAREANAGTEPAKAGKEKGERR